MGKGGSKGCTTEHRWMRKIIFFCTERQWLIFYNCLLGISSSCLVGNSLWIIWMLYKGFLFDDSKEEDAQLIWNFVFLTLLGVFLIVAAVLGFIAANKVSVDMLVLYFWSCMFLLAPLLIFAVSCFTFQKFTMTWLKHRWHDVQMREVRRLFCNPAGADMLRAEYGKLWVTNGLCSAPWRGGEDYSDVTEWCLATHNTTVCSDVIGEAQDDLAEIMKLVFTNTGIAALVAMLGLLVCLRLTYFIVTPETIKRSMNAYHNCLLFPPSVLCIAFGAELTERDDLIELDENMVWIGQCFLASGTINVVMGLAGIVGGRRKSREVLVIYLVGMLAVFALLLSIIIGCYYIVVNLQDYIASDYGITSKNKDKVACRAGLHDCCCCDVEPQECPEWDATEVNEHIQVYLQFLALCAIASDTFVGASIILAFFMVLGLKNYKCEYV